MSERRGSPRIDRLPSARGPHSIRPWNQPMTRPAAMAAAVRWYKAGSLSILSTEQRCSASLSFCAVSSAWTSSVEYDGPR